MWSNTLNFMGASPGKPLPPPGPALRPGCGVASTILNGRKIKGVMARDKPRRNSSKRLRPARGLAPLDLLDLVGLGAARRHHLDARALAFADERARERRRDRNLALLGVGLGLA